MPKLKLKHTVKALRVQTQTVEGECKILEEWLDTAAPPHGDLMGVTRTTVGLATVYVAIWVHLA